MPAEDSFTFPLHALRETLRALRENSSVNYKIILTFNFKFLTLNSHIDIKN
jgi:hypothetical protein